MLFAFSSAASLDGSPLGFLRCLCWLWPTPATRFLFRTNLTENDMKRGENYYFNKATQEVLQFSLEKEYKDNFVFKNGIYHYVGRILGSQVISSPEDKMFNLSPLSFIQPSVDRYSPVAYSVMLYCHEAVSHHHSGTSTILESRHAAYILKVKGRDLASAISRFYICYKLC